tara:strand:- start:2214 stop:2762 length:549 start_codon:yes stop_codon:yes gene_type:complete
MKEPMTSLFGLMTRWWTAFALGISLAMLATAHAFERFAGLSPCNLCLRQREVFWGAVTIALAATFWALISRASRGTPRIASFLLFLVFLTGAVTAGFHAGGELHWWELPATCAAGTGGIDLEALTSLALGTGPVSRIAVCDAVAWSWLGVSMAGWNALISAGLAIISLLAAKRPKDARAPRN